MSHPDFAVVTGAFGCTGRCVAQRLVEGGLIVGTLTLNPDLNDPFDKLEPPAYLDLSDHGAD